MPYVKTIDVEQLHLPSDPTYWVKIKSRATFPDVEAAQDALVEKAKDQMVASVKSHAGNGAGPESAAVIEAKATEAAEGALTEVEFGAYSHVLMWRLITEWNLTGLDGNVLPLDDSSLVFLEPEDGQFLVAEVTKRARRRSQAEAIPFGKRSGRRSMAIGSKTERR